MSNTQKQTPGEVLRRNVKRLREGQRLTYVELSDRLKQTGNPIPLIGLRRLEQGERRVDVNDLVALAYVLGVSVVDLLVPSDKTGNTPYDVTPEIRVTVKRARDWISGQGFLASPSSPAALARELQWMPRERAEIAVREWLDRQAPAGTTV